MKARVTWKHFPNMSTTISVWTQINEMTRSRWNRGAAVFGVTHARWESYQGEMGSNHAYCCQEPAPRTQVWTTALVVVCFSSSWESPGGDCAAFGVL